jgi:hypothetical protein
MADSINTCEEWQARIREHVLEHGGHRYSSWYVFVWLAGADTTREPHGFSFNQRGDWDYFLACHGALKKN